MVCHGEIKGHKQESLSPITGQEGTEGHHTVSSSLARDEAQIYIMRFYSLTTIRPEACGWSERRSHDCELLGWSSQYTNLSFSTYESQTSTHQFT